MISVLLVDDEPQLLELTKYFLERSDEFRAVPVTSAKEATARMAQEEFDAVVCDYQMPDMDGLEFLKLLRNQKNDIPFILFTGKGREDVAIEALNSGADFYLQKGGDPRPQFAELVNMIKTSVAAVRSGRQLESSERRYRSTFENTGSAIVIIDEDSTISLANSEFEKLSGYSKEEIQGKMKWGSFVVKKDLRRLTEYHDTRLKDPEKAPRSYQFTAKDRFGNEKHLLATAAMVPGTKKTVVSVIDETERRFYEDVALQAARKIDLLSRITRHDILNQLSILFGYLELARERVDDPDVADILRKAKGASESIRKHMEFARDYQRMGTKRPQWIDVQAAYKRAASNLDLREMAVDAELGGLEVFSDPMLEKVFYNLMDNVMRHGRTATRIRFHYSHGPEGMTVVCEDDGVGVPDEDKASLFERGTEDGSGLRGYGLYLAREILGMTGMTISETGEPGKGARFEMAVPRGRYRTKDLSRRKRHAKGRKTGRR